MSSFQQEQERQQRLTEDEDSFSDSSAVDELDFMTLVSRMQHQWQEKEEQQEFRFDPLKDSHSKLLIEKAIVHAEQLVRHSMLVPEKAQEGKDCTAPPPGVALFDRREIEKGALLGSGGFARVHEVTAFLPTRRSSSTSRRSSSISAATMATTSTTSSASMQTCYSPQVQAARDFIVTHAIRESTGECRFAMKHLKRMHNAEKFANGIVDLAVEAHLMSVLDHPNVLKIRGVAAAGPRAVLADSAASAGGINHYDDYFLIVDKIHETLDERIDSWRRQLKRLNRRPGPTLFAPKRRAKQREAKRRRILLEQLQVAHDLASALQYLHDKGVMHRDVKPCNVGFDAHGELKLFDFGLATELQTDNDDPNGTPTSICENVGSSRYIAPEVAKSEQYGMTADCYSYAMTLYEILSQTRPWEKNICTQRNNRRSADIDNFNMDEPIRFKGDLLDGDQGSAQRRKQLQTQDKIFKAPSVSSDWPLAIQSMLQRAWSVDSSKRPSMSEIRETLSSEISMLQDEKQQQRSSSSSFSLSSSTTKKTANETSAVSKVKTNTTVAARRRSSFSSYVAASLQEILSDQDAYTDPEASGNTCTTEGTTSDENVQLLQH